MNRSLLFAALFVILSPVVKGQQEKKVKKKSAGYKKMSLEIAAGTPITITSIPGSLSSFGSLGLRYNLTEAISLQPAFQIGNMNGKQIAQPLTAPERVDNYESFNNDFTQYSMNVQLNIAALFKLQDQLGKLIPYVYGGMGRINSNITSIRVDGRVKEFTKDFYTNYYGVVFRYYLNPQLDLSLGMSIHNTETYFIDGVQFDLKFDSYLLPYLGINYKIGTNNKKQHIEWQHVPLPKGLHIVDPDNKDGQPMADEMNPMKKDSAQKLVAANTELKKENQEVKKENTELKEEVKELKETVQTLKEEVETLKQNGTQPAAGTAPKQTYTPGGNNNSGTETPKTKTSKTANVLGANTTASGQNENSQAVDLSQYDGIVSPPEKYNVIVGTYFKSKSKYAFVFRDRLRSQGYDAAIFSSSDASKYIRVAILSTGDRKEAFKVMKLARVKIDAGSWIHIYDK